MNHTASGSFQMSHEPGPRVCCCVSSIIHSLNKCLLSAAHHSASKIRRPLLRCTYVPVGRCMAINETKGKRQTAASQELTWSLPWSVHSPRRPSTASSVTTPPQRPSSPMLSPAGGGCRAQLWRGTCPDVDHRRSASLHARTSPGHQPGQAAPPRA